MYTHSQPIPGSWPKAQSIQSPPRGALWVNVLDFGAIADGTTDNSTAIQSAHDHLVSLMKYPNSSKGIVFIPSAPLPYAINKSIFIDSTNVEVHGEGWGSVIQMQGGHSPFIFGVRRVESQVVNGVQTPLAITAANRPDCYGKLDATATPAPGQRWGLRTNGNSFIQFQHGPMSCGPSSTAGQYFPDYWTQTQQLTVEFCIEPPDGQSFPLNSPVMGFGTTDFPSPWLIQTWDEVGKFWVGFQTADNIQRTFGFRLGTAKPPHRIALQFDLLNGVKSGILVNGSLVPIIQTSNMPIPAGSNFIANEIYPFMLGCDNIHGPYNSGPGIDLRIYGLRVSNTLRYGNSPPPNDATRYFGVDSHTVCYLAGTDNPATTPAAGRVVTVAHGPAAAPGPTDGLFLHTHTSGGIGGNAIRNLSIIGGNGWGAGVCFGGVLEMTIENVKSINAFQSIGSFNMFANYNIYISNCWLEGYDSCFSGYWTRTIAHSIYFGRAGRDTIRHVGGSGRWSDTFVAFSYPGVTQTIFKAKAQEYGGHFTIDNMEVDFEGDTLILAAIYCEAMPSSSGTTLNLHDVFLGTIGSNASLVMLKDMGKLGGEFNRCWLSVRNLQAYTDQYAASIDVDGPLWYGEVEGTALIGPVFKHRQKWGTNTNIVISDKKYTAPPTTGAWYAGAHRLIVGTPGPGQATEWRCVQTGVYGTASPPVWAGINPVPVPVVTPPNIVADSLSPLFGQPSAAEQPKGKGRGFAWWKR